MTLQRLQTAIKGLEQAMPPLALALHRASPAVREAYKEYRTDGRVWCQRYPGPGDAYEAYLDGSAMPPTMPAILISVLPHAPLICAGDNAAEIYHTFKEGR